jgi:hypothetical protein
VRESVRMTEEYSEVYPEVESGVGAGGGIKQMLYRPPRDVYERALEKYESGEKPNFKEYGRKEYYVVTEAAVELTAEEVRRRYGAGYYIVGRLHAGNRTPEDFSFINIPPRGETVLPAANSAGYYGRQRYGPNQPRYGRLPNGARRPRRGAGASDKLARELVEAQRQLYQDTLEREREHNRELREAERRHAEEVRRLERERDAERFKSLEEKITAAGERKGDEPSDFNTKLLDFALKRLEGGDAETADALVKKAFGDDEGGGFLGLARDIFETVKEDPRGAAQFAAAIMPGMFGGAAPIQPQPQPATAAPIQPPQQPQAGPAVSRDQFTDVQLVTGVASALSAGIVGDNDPTPYAQEIRDILEERPHLRGQLEGMLEQSDEDLLSTVSMVARVSFESLGRKPLKWARDFRKALKCYGIGAAVPPVEPASNGHAPAAQG